MRNSNRPILYSLLSGCVWAVVGFGVAWSVSPIGSTPSEVGRMFLGGIIAAPVIGVLVGLLSREFSELGRPARIMIALADLYLAVWLFLLATNVVRVLFGGAGPLQASEAFVSGPVVGTLLGLTYTGFVVLLWPLSYVNHTLVAREWSRIRDGENEASEPAAGPGGGR